MMLLAGNSGHLLSPVDPLFAEMDQFTRTEFEALLHEIHEASLTAPLFVFDTSRPIGQEFEALRHQG